MPVIKLRRLLSRLTLLLLLVLTFVARSHNRGDIFQNDGKLYFYEGDCYSRMTRVKSAAGCGGAATSATTPTGLDR